MRKDDCIFCKIVNGDIPSRKLYEDDKFIVIMDITPVSKGHSLIIPKEHYANIYEMPNELAGEAMKVAQKMAVKMKAVLKPDGFNVVQNNDKVGGQTVFHFHMHLIPRYEGEANLVFCGEPQSVSVEELDKTMAEIIK